MSVPDKVRLFVAVTVPAEQLDALETDTSSLKERLTGARWTANKNRHVTLKFLGSTPSDQMDRIGRICASMAAKHQVTNVSLAGLGAFPSEKRARVLWAGIEDDDNLLAIMAGELSDALEPMGFEPEARAFTPHLTLARLKTPGKLPELPGLTEVTREPFEVREVVLFRSHLSPRGARYEALDRYPLRKSP
jgi:RNA 2',3'-cyclic 3'-phosphodiesterase